MFIVKKFLYNLPFIFINCFVWCILNENFSFTTIFSGLVLGYIAIITGEKFLGISNGPDHFSINIRKFVLYLFNLFYQIYKNAFKAIIIIITGKTNVTSIRIKTSVKNDFHKIILSNSITLTPGTITIHQEKDNLTVLCLSTNNKNTTELEDMVKGSFENILEIGGHKC